MQLLVICNYIWTFLQLFPVLVIFATSLWLFWCSSFHLNNILFGFHPRRTIYVPLVANVNNLVATLWVYNNILWILKNIVVCIRICKCIWTTILYVYSSIIIIINGLNIFMVTLISVYLSTLKFYVRYLLNILCTYYNFIQTILLYFLKYYKQLTIF
jgi:hypothetical protein